MSDIERQEGQRQPEQSPSINSVHFRIADGDMAPFEALTTTPGLYLLGELSPMARPVKALTVRLEVQASKDNDNNNPYWLRTDINLRGNYTRRPDNSQRFTDRVEDFFEPIRDYNSEGEEPQLFFTTEGGYAYFLWRDEDMGLISLHTIGAHDDDKVLGVQNNLDRTDYFDVAFEDFLKTSEDLLDILYQAYDRNTGSHPVMLQAPGYEVSEEQTAEEPSKEASQEPPQPEPTASKPASTELVPVAHQPEIVLPRLDDIAGLEAEKEELLNHVVMIQNADTLAKWGVERRPSGILLYGPAGTGKTTLAKAVAGELGAKLVEVNSKFYGTFMGQSENNFSAILDDVEKTTEPLVLLFDELDGIITNSSSAYKTVKTLFKQRIGTIVDNNPNVAVIATTNEKDEIDETIIRAGRFDIKMYIPLPTSEGLVKIFGQVMMRSLTADTERQVFADFGGDMNINELAAAAENWSGAQVVSLFNAVKAAKAVEEVLTGQVPGPVTQADMLRAIDKQNHQS